MVCIRVTQQNSPETLDTDLPVCHPSHSGHTPVAQDATVQSFSLRVFLRIVSLFPFESGPWTCGDTMVNAPIWTKIRSQELDCPENALRC